MGVWLPVLCVVLLQWSVHKTPLHYCVTVFSSKLMPVGSALVRGGGFCGDGGWSFAFPTGLVAFQLCQPFVCLFCSEEVTALAAIRVSEPSRCSLVMSLCSLRKCFSFWSMLKRTSCSSDIEEVGLGFSAGDPSTPSSSESIRTGSPAFRFWEALSSTSIDSSERS